MSKEYLNIYSRCYILSNNIVQNVYPIKFKSIVFPTVVKSPHVAVKQLAVSAAHRINLQVAIFARKKTNLVEEDFYSGEIRQY